MVTHKVNRKRSKGLTFALFPVLMVIFVMGWCIYFMGDDKRMNARVKATASPKVQEDSVTFLAMPFEEKQEIVSS